MGAGASPTASYFLDVNNGASTISALPRCQPTVIGLVTTATSATLYLDGVQAGTPAASSGSSATCGDGGFGVFGEPKETGYKQGGDFLAFALYNSSLNSTQAAAVSAAMLPPQQAMTRNIVFNGDSITSGLFATCGQNLPKQVEPLLGHPCTMYNLGIPSILATSLTSNQTSYGPLLFSSGVTSNIYHWWGGTNDITNGTAGATLFSSTVAPHLTYMKGLGYKIVVGTLLNEQGSATTNTQRANYNAAALAAVGTTVDALADYAGAALLANSSANKYFGTDGIHLTPLGYQIAAPICAAAINPLL